MALQYLVSQDAGVIFSNYKMNVLWVVSGLGLCSSVPPLLMSVYLPNTTLPQIISNL